MKQTMIQVTMIISTVIPENISIPSCKFISSIYSWYKLLGDEMYCQMSYSKIISFNCFKMWSSISLSNVKRVCTFNWMIDENKKNGNEYTVFYIYKEIKK